MLKVQRYLGVVKYSADKPSYLLISVVENSDGINYI